PTTPGEEPRTEMPNRLIPLKLLSMMRTPGELRISRPIRARLSVLPATVVPVTAGPTERATRPPQRTSLFATTVPVAPTRTAIPVTGPQTMLPVTTVPTPPSTMIPPRRLASASLPSTAVPADATVRSPAGDAPLT